MKLNRAEQLFERRSKTDISIFTTDHIRHPLWMFQIPTNRLGDAFLEIKGWIPPDFILKFLEIDGVAAVVAGSVYYICEKRSRW